MAPRSLNRPNRNASTTLDTSSTVASFQQTEWDTTPLKLPGFWAYVKEQAPNENIKFKTLVENGFTVSSRSHQVCVVNLQHALQLQNRSFGPYTFDNPSPRNGPTTGLLPTSLTVTVAAPAPANASAPAAAPTRNSVNRSPCYWQWHSFSLCRRP